MGIFLTLVFALASGCGDGAKGLTGDYLWPEFDATWPVMSNPDANSFPGPAENMKAPSVSSWYAYLPFWNTAILLFSSVTIHWAHSAIKANNHKKLIGWLGFTVLLGIIFVGLQIEEYVIAYTQMGLTLDSGIYGSTFFLLTGFHGFHVTLGTIILIVQLYRAIKGHFNAKDCFGFEAASWYWHFVDVVWVGLFIFVYVL